MAEQVLRTLMRTTDLLVAGFFSPAAVAAVGLADIYGRLTLWLGLGIGDGAIALSSQDTGSGRSANRDEAVTQALLVGVLAGIPFVLFGLVGSFWAIEILGADAETVRLGGLYLAIIFITAPAFHVTMIAARSIQGTGDTRTPMYVNAGANALNIVLTVVLAFGLGPFPELSIVGIAVATAIGDTLAALTFLGVIYSARSELSLVRPTQWIIAKQLLVISAPRIAEGIIELVAEFPFNAILLAFGTEVNAAYHIGRRVYQQISSPLARGYGTAANILSGQALGRGEADAAYFNGLAAAGLAVLTVGGLGAVIFVAAEPIVRLFTSDPATIGYATGFARAYAVATALIACYIVLAGSLRGGSETRPPFVAKLTGAVCFLLGITYVFGVGLEYGVVAAYVAIVADFVWRNVVVGAVYLRGNWLERGTDMMAERGSLRASDED
ncbi:MATE family efflux transporter [Natronolimnohabitans innermongolicus]|uniref:Multidrug-efflux transporter n=1 Tax=Natronolimnohabitans innermongolicus JCM 12255 TaxID=1227499 RepID=L9X7J3_9EURY|nr:MATE family efflux transporter [Natronolimnohabitans innermongolicus]ELY57744.1 MATE efflux family protein [Natronolimnohabitans innermongolicus JCM 12255]